MKRILSVFFCLIFVLGTVLPCTVFADQEVKNDESEARIYGEVRLNSDGTFGVSEEILSEGDIYEVLNYMNYNQAGGAIVVSKDIKLKQGLTVQPVNNKTSFILIDGNVEIDLNGYFITQLSGPDFSENPLIVVPKGSSLSLKDSSAEKKGIVNGVQSAIVVNGGTLNISGGKVLAQSQASLFPDEYELPVVVKFGGIFNMSNGFVEYNGNLDDGREYLQESCAISVDETSFMFVSGGEIKGEIKGEEKSNWYLKGGTFSFDVSELLSPIYKCEEQKGKYSVTKDLPHAEAFRNGLDAGVTVNAVYNDNEDRVLSYEVDARTGTNGFGVFGADISDVIKAANSFGDDKIADVKIFWDSVTVYLDKETVKALKKASANGMVYCNTEVTTAIDDQVREKINSGKFVVECCFTDSEGNEINISNPFEIEIAYPTTNDGETIRLYTLGDVNPEEKVSEYRQNNILCRVMNGEKVLVSEGVVLAIIGRTLDLRGTISIIFYTSLQGVDVEKVKMLFWDAPQSEYTVETAMSSVEYSSKSDKGYKFEFKNISSKDMNRQIYARLVAEDRDGNLIYGTEPGEGYSIVSYAQNMMGNAKLKPLLVKMLNYGAASQEYFGSETALANDFLGDAEKVTDYTKIYRNEAEVIQEPSANGECLAKIIGKSLTLEGDISINYYVKSDEPVDEVGVLFWTEEAFEGTENHILGTQSRQVRNYSLNGSYKVFSYKNIVSSEIFESVYARVYTKKDNVYTYGDIEKYSVRDYAAKQIEDNKDSGLIKLLRTLLLYGDEAEKYFRLNN